MRSVCLLTVFGAILLISAGCSALNSGVQVSHVSTNTIADLQVDMKIGDKVTSTCTVTRVLGIPFGDFSWFSNRLADNVTYDTNVRRHIAGRTTDSSSNMSSGIPNPLISMIDFLAGVIGFNGVADIKECEKVAAHKIATKDGIDIIYAPRYLSDSTGFPVLFRRTEVTLTGYAGKISGFKQLDSQTRSGE